MSGEFVKTSIVLDYLANKEETEQRQDKLTQQIKEKEIEHDILKDKIRHEQVLRDISQAGTVSKSQLEEKEKEIQRYKDLLAKPMIEIAEQSGAFKETYEEQQNLLAKWIVSQRAFKDIAMKYGQMAGKTPEEIQSELSEATKKVLNNEASFPINNADKTDLSSRTIDKLKKTQS